ncbi:MAG TPA: hypothetical protein VE395_07665 [Acidimicrobiales bacterium]|jgi:hypothetical protein|nr:hypothetical protein [Acidimicrobiales bacterium]
MSTYEIVVQGSVRGVLSRALDGFDVVPGGAGTTHFRGVVADQRELHTALRRISSCNLQLTSIQRIDEGPSERGTGGPGG